MSSKLEDIGLNVVTNKKDHSFFRKIPTNFLHKLTSTVAAVLFRKSNEIMFQFQKKKNDHNHKHHQISQGNIVNESHSSLEEKWDQH